MKNLKVDGKFKLTVVEGDTTAIRKYLAEEHGFTESLSDGRALKEFTVVAFNELLDKVLRPKEKE